MEDQFRVQISFTEGAYELMVRGLRKLPIEDAEGLLNEIRALYDSQRQQYEKSVAEKILNTPESEPDGATGETPNDGKPKQNKRGTK